MSKKKNTCHVVGGDWKVQKMFCKGGYEIVALSDNPDFVVFTGGADISSELYGMTRGKSGPPDTARDAREQNVFKYCTTGKIPMVGICRGAQFLNVMSGGKLWQDVNNHALSGLHQVLVKGSDKVYEVTSTHHQQMIPSPKGCVVAWAPGLSTHKCNQYGATYVSEKDAEVVVYKDTKCLCFQPHPEYDNMPKKSVDWFFGLVRAHTR